jgi:hypothetical protein
MAAAFEEHKAEIFQQMNYPPVFCQVWRCLVTGSRRRYDLERNLGHGAAYLRRMLGTKGPF